MATKAPLTPEEKRLKELLRRADEADSRLNASINQQYDSLAKIREAQAPSGSRREKLFRRASIGAEGALDNTKLNSQEAKAIADTIVESLSIINPANVTSRELKALRQQVTLLQSETKNLPDKQDGEQLFASLEAIKGELNGFAKSSPFGGSGFGKVAGALGSGLASGTQHGISGLVSAATGGNKAAAGLTNAAFGAVGGLWNIGKAITAPRSNISAQIAEKTNLIQAKIAESAARNDMNQIGAQISGVGGIARVGGVAIGKVASAMSGSGSSDGGIQELVNIAKAQKLDISQWIKTMQYNSSEEKYFRESLLDKLDEIYQALDGDGPKKKKKDDKDEKESKGKIGDFFKDALEGIGAIFTGSGLVKIIAGLANVIGKVTIALGVGWLGWEIGKWVGDKTYNTVKDKPGFTNTIDYIGDAMTGKKKASFGDTKSMTPGEAAIAAAQIVGGGVDAGVLMGIKNIETRPNDPNNIKNKNSSATGPWQITTETANSLRKKYPQFGYIINGDVSDPLVNAMMAALINREGIERKMVTGAQAYLEHQAGDRDAQKLKRASPTAIAADIVGHKNAMLNQSIYYNHGVPRTVGEVNTYLGRVDRDRENFDMNNIQTKIAMSKYLSAQEEQRARTRAAIARDSGGSTPVVVSGGGGSSGGGSTAPVAIPDSTLQACNAANLVFNQCR